VVDKVKVEDKDRVLKRGNVGRHGMLPGMQLTPQTIHKRLEREIHPEEIRVTATTREDVWGLRYVWGGER
jgi:exonuclease V